MYRQCMRFGFSSGNSPFILHNAFLCSFDTYITLYLCVYYINNIICRGEQMKGLCLQKWRLREARPNNKFRNKQIKYLSKNFNFFEGYITIACWPKSCLSDSQKPLTKNSYACQVVSTLNRPEFKTFEPIIIFGILA